MLRSLIFLALLGVATFGFIYWATNHLNADPGVTVTPPNNDDDRKRDEDRKKKKPAAVAQVEPRTFSATKAPGTTGSGMVSTDRGEALIIPNARINHIYEADLASEREGELTVLGVELLNNEPVDETKRLQVEVGFLAIQATEAEIRKGIRRVKVQGAPEVRVWRRWFPDDQIVPHRVGLGVEQKFFRKIQIGEKVRRGQLLGIVTPRIVMDELRKKISEFNATESKRIATEKTMLEAEKRHKSIVKARRITSGAYSEEEERGAALTHERYKSELAEALENIKIKRAEIMQTLTTMQRHELRAGISGVVTEKDRRATEAVKPGERVLKIVDMEHLQAEGLVEVQKARHLEIDMPVLIEFARPVDPVLTLSGHLQKINAVAVTKGAIPSIVSASEDGKVRVTPLRLGNKNKKGEQRWLQQNQVWALPHYMPVRSVACAPKGADHNLCLTGTSDGVARLWDLDKLDKSKVIQLSERHNGAINSTAFSPDGKLCCTGGEDRSIRIFATANGEQLHHLEGAHRGAVSSVRFVSNEQLLSVGYDNQMILWSLAPKKKPKMIRIFRNRAGKVDNLGVHPDGKHVLLDKDNELRIQTLADNNTASILKSDSQGVDFSTLALFSPDGETILTGSTADEHIQLWRNPLHKGSTRRPAEIQRLIMKRDRMTCAAFAPEADIVVTGTEKSQVLVWRLPKPAEVKEAEPNAKITYIDGKVDASNRRLIHASFDKGKKPKGLVHGLTASIVIYPQ